MSYVSDFHKDRLKEKNYKSREENQVNKRLKSQSNPTASIPVYLMDNPCDGTLY